MKTAAVIGGGIQGCCMALMLARNGFRVVLYEKAPFLMTRASVNNEGKIHLGYVYSLDKTMVTAERMIDGALHFAPVVERLIGGQLPWDEHMSDNFIYGVHNDTDLGAEEHIEHFTRLNALFQEKLSNTGLHYFGKRPGSIWKESHANGMLNPDQFLALFQTEEIAIDTHWLRNTIIGAIETTPDISVSAGSAITTIKRTNGRWNVFYNHPDGSGSGLHDIVVNCAWDGRLGIDRAAGLTDKEPECVRIKYGFMFRSPNGSPNAPSITITHGPFGDLVNFPGKNTVYMSWYPDCMTWMGNTDELPQDQEKICAGVHDISEVKHVLGRSLIAIEKIAPGFSRLECSAIRVGPIVGHAKTDITDIKSGLHKRLNNIDEPAAGYYSVFTGKYTCAPYNTLMLEQHIQA